MRNPGIHFAIPLKKTLLFCLFSLCCGNVSLAQPSKVDSLKRVISLAKDDTTKVWQMITLADLLSNFDQPKTIEVLEGAKLLSNRLGYQAGVALSERWMGDTYRKGRYFDDAIAHTREAVRLFHQLGRGLDLAASYVDLGKTLAGFYRLQSGTRLDTRKMMLLK